MSFVYILTNKNNSIFYTGSTSDLKRRIREHRKKSSHSFTNRYNLQKLVYFEIINSIHERFGREKYLKGKKRRYKQELIEKKNPQYLDLSAKL